MLSSAVRGAAVLALSLAALSVSCSASPETDAADSAPAAATAAAVGEAAGSASTPSASPAPDEPPAEKVRDAFAGLQATLGDSCTPGNCAYFLDRVYDELHRLDRAMKADPKGPGHFTEPIELIAELDAEVGGDQSFENLKKHRSTLIGTRDTINTWMQDHPDDYR
ncbi:hypothetical protein [Streptomyces sp.]|uniref:hypothetical protein n=1 Tax=Streptomyces sp. TaxID=1931 RepID=UPI002811A9C8|nr:hypothetical protein [Streptomyces sp.]